MEMLAYRGILDRFTTGNFAPQFLNFGVFILDLHKLDFPHPYGVVIPQACIEALLEVRAKELGAEMRRGHELVGLTQDAQSVRINFHWVSALRAGDPILRLLMLHAALKL
jgi:rifampicin monooxygenase